jgi:hypothetical protein
MKGRLKFNLLEGTKKEPEVIEVINHRGEFLGEIYYKGRWKKWIFQPDMETFYDASCLLEVVKQLNKLDANRKE